MPLGSRPHLNYNFEDEELDTEPHEMIEPFTLDESVEGLLDSMRTSSDLADDGFAQVVTS